MNSDKWPSSLYPSLPTGEGRVMLKGNGQTSSLPSRWPHTLPRSRWLPLEPLPCVPRHLVCVLRVTLGPLSRGCSSCSYSPQEMHCLEKPPLSSMAGRQDSPSPSFWLHKLLDSLQSPNPPPLECLCLSYTSTLHAPCTCFSFSTQYRNNHKVTQTKHTISPHLPSFSLSLSYNLVYIHSCTK